MYYDAVPISLPHQMKYNISDITKAPDIYFLLHIDNEFRFSIRNVCGKLPFQNDTECIELKNDDIHNDWYMADTQMVYCV